MAAPAVDYGEGKKAAREVLDKYLQILEDCHESGDDVSRELVDGTHKALEAFQKAHQIELQHLAPGGKGKTWTT